MFSPLIFELNCLVLGDNRNHIFPVKIPSTESVGTLKKAIKDEKKNSLQFVDADSLILWKVSIPVDKDFEYSLKAHHPDFVDEESLTPVGSLSGFFSEPPVSMQLHIVVKLPIGKC